MFNIEGALSFDLLWRQKKKTTLLTFFHSSVAVLY